MVKRTIVNIPLLEVIHRTRVFLNEGKVEKCTIRFVLVFEGSPLRE
jgi:hypothetical protein